MYTKNQILDVLEQMGIKKGIISGDEYSTSCPFPEHEDKRPSFGINLISGLWICRSLCGGGNLPQLAERLDYKLDDKFLLAEPESLFDIEEKEQEEIDINKELIEVKFPFKFTGEIPEFIKERGFTDSSLTKKWEMCYNKDTGSLVLPIRDWNKRIVGWVSRRQNGIEPRYLYSPKGIFEKSKVLYGEYLLRKEQNLVCICEGSLNAIWLDKHGYNAIALLGKDVSDIQLKRLINLRKGEYVICLDNDEPGQNAIDGYKDKRNKYHLGLIDKLGKYAIISRIELPEDKKDVQDVRDSQQLVNIIENRKLVY